MHKLKSRFAVTGGGLAVAGAGAFLVSGYGYQWGWWELGFAFRYLLFGGGMLGLAGFIVSFLGFLPEGAPPEQGAAAVTGIVLGALTLLSFSYWYHEAQKYPPIHDITTDIENPPRFKAVTQVRAGVPNPTEYGGSEVAEVQKEHYPDIRSLVVDAPYEETFERALNAARRSWELVDYSIQEGRIEATHTLPWYGFKDDVVIRIDTLAGDPGSTVVDVRSVSRIGRGDLGVNADRIRRYLRRLEK